MKQANTTSIPWAMKWLLEAFTGELSNTVHCLNCRNQSITTEPFCDLSIDFPASGPKER